MEIRISGRTERATRWASVGPGSGRRRERAAYSSVSWFGIACSPPELDVAAWESGHLGSFSSASHVVVLIGLCRSGQQIGEYHAGHQRRQGGMDQCGLDV